MVWEDEMTDQDIGLLVGGEMIAFDYCGIVRDTG